MKYLSKHPRVPNNFILLIIGITFMLLIKCFQFTNNIVESMQYRKYDNCWTFENINQLRTSKDTNYNSLLSIYNAIQIFKI